MQNIFCSLYGLKLYRGRYTPPFSTYFKSLLNSEGFSEEEITRLQRNRLLNLLEGAKKYTAYYGPILPEFSSQDTLDVQEILSHVPVLKKDSFRSSPEAFLSKKFDHKKLIKINTSGTTGAPMTVYMTPEARKMNYAFFARAKKWAGTDGFERSLTFAGRLVVPMKQKSPPYWRSNIFFRNRLFSSYHLSEKNLPSYVDSILRYQPNFIDSYPSSLYPIAEYILNKGITGIRPKGILTSSETLLEHQREAIEKAFSCKVFDQYGSAEQAIFVSQCEHGSYHLNPEYGLLEVVDKKNNPVRAGELGEFVCTGFTNEAMPLIRYKIGDMGIVSKDNCPCGRNFPVIEKIIGRMDDILVTPEGNYVGRLDPVFKGMSNTIKETQIIQYAPDLVEVIIVKAAGYLEKDGGSVVTELKKRMGDQVTFRIHYTDEIKRTPNGKFRAVVNNIPAS